MTSNRIERQIEAIAGLPGVVGCALVEIEGGLTWCSAGGPDIMKLAEAATDYWRLTQRHGPLLQSVLGDLRAQTFIHSEARITSVACPQGLLLVTVSGEPDAVDWRLWKACVGLLHAVVRAH
ncbi:MAG: hypothetical protein EOO24_29155 [Comamonadaceae bacterium]|nr:MAG: hypothetical protein EOO24_29155 [Comamonadaceae bacterium]